ncbi:hypothetical protein [Plasmodium yoelii yoelii]|uniref:UBC core domain-containing protein n=1 Tax=Plasmodium yoelii yoelii TaxID=73239 RepID=Q7RIL5_PLAYO|nr:hypothetical protein [Plasmodium yoelii yoelii]
MKTHFYQHSNLHTQYYIKCLYFFFNELSRDHNVGFSVGLVDDSNFFEWNVCFEGPKNTLYEG